MIKMQIIGHLGKDCSVNTVNGKNVINFTLAHSEKYKDAQGNLQDRTIWVDCSYWTDKTAVAQYLTKGKMIYADGQPDVKAFQRNDGTPGSSLTLRVREVQLLSSRGEGGGSMGGSSSSPATVGNNMSAPNDITEPVDDLPF